MSGENTATAEISNHEIPIGNMLGFMVRALVDHPEEVTVEFFLDEEDAVFEIRAHPDDVGQLIGRKGQTARALESIVNANWRRSGRRYHLDILAIGEDEDEDPDQDEDQDQGQ